MNLTLTPAYGLGAHNRSPIGGLGADPLVLIVGDQVFLLWDVEGSFPFGHELELLWTIQELYLGQYIVEVEVYTLPGLDVDLDARI
ncbi:MAG: hypothetical protein R3330_02820 [Saprospiraceae bacterium]|nr:hypothetical protein [Saprospiraceae bacterium]